MERLTKENEKYGGNLTLGMKRYNKLFDIEEIEKELGIDLITLFKAIKSKIIWVKINEIEYHFEDEYNERNWDLQNGFLYMYWEDGSHCCLELSNYGKTWWLEKPEEELKND